MPRFPKLAQLPRPVGVVSISTEVGEGGHVTLLIAVMHNCSIHVCAC